MYIVKFMKPSLKQHKVDINRLMYLNGIPFNVSTSFEVWAIHDKHYDNYTILSRIKFNKNVAHDYWRFVIACVEKLTRGIQQNHGEPFVHVMHDMVTLNDGNNYLGVSVSLMVDFDLYRLAVALIPNNVSHSSNYNADLLQKILKERGSNWTFTNSTSRWPVTPPIRQHLWHASSPPGPSNSTVKCTSWIRVWSMAS